MASFNGIVEWVKGKIQARQAEEQQRDALPDDMTRDRYLRNLRRERRVQMEEVEKELLIKQIAEYKKDRTARMMYGVRNYKVLKDRRVSNLKNARRPILKQQSHNFIGRGMI